ncbi:MAG: DUF1828 domain-containing protein [Chlorobiaceae bacterium]|nr:DUF1828 domain-containing protein [Chlorobiaceae bacterium]
MMTIDVTFLQKTLCNAMCSEVHVREKTPDILAVDTPFTFPDGDQYQLYIKILPGGILRLSDMGHTLMHLSYEHDIDKLREGTRGLLFEKIKSETSVEERQGSLCIDTSPENLAADIFRLGQAITSIFDLSFLKRSRVESTFYDDLRESLFRFVPTEKIRQDYLYEEIDNASDYPIDYRIEGKEAPVFLFGIPNRGAFRGRSAIEAIGYHGFPLQARASNDSPVSHHITHRIHRHSQPPSGFGHR